MARAINTVTDSIDFYVENHDFTVPNVAPYTKSSVGLTVTGTATSTQNGADILNLKARGAYFFIAFATIAATCTVRLNIQGKDPASGNYYTIASLSVDNVTVTSAQPNASNSFLNVYPGATGGAATINGVALPRVFRCQASITVLATSTASPCAFTVGTQFVI